MPHNHKLITAHALASALHLSVETIWRYTREKKIPYVKLGGKQYRYNFAEVVKTLGKFTARESPAEYNLQSGKKLNYLDYLKLPEEPGYRFELLEGLLVKDPSPGVLHQRVLFNLARILEKYFRNYDPEGEVFIAPLDITLSDINVVQPDLFYVSGKQKSIVKDTRIDGAPELVVEILSPSTRRKDRFEKMGIYKEAGIAHYWLVNPEEKTFECFALDCNNYYIAASGMEQEVVNHKDFPGLSVNLTNLW